MTDKQLQSNSKSSDLVIQKYRPIIGMEIHAELKTKSKMFCACKNDPFKAPKPNIYTCPVCLGLPGALPVANQKAIEWTIKVGLALGCKINLFSKFDRKNYFYPDLPKGYQISQYDLPFCYSGQIKTSEGIIRIRRIHLEEDTAKLIHKTINHERVSLIDFNRSSVPLVEIVTEPDIKSAGQAKEYAKKIRQIIRYLDIGDGDMEQGGMRLEANISLSKNKSLAKNSTAYLNDTDLPKYKVELKNINSFRFLEQAITEEISRQSQLLDQNKTPIQETRGFDAKKGITFTQRVKEEAADYRYFPDPDLPPFQFTQKEIEKIRKTLPELPVQKIQRWQKDYQIDATLAERLTINKPKADYFDQVFQQAKKSKINANDLAKAIINKKIDYQINDQPNKIIQLFKASKQTEEIDDQELSKIINSVLSDNTDAVQKYRAGKQQVLGFLIGQVMRKLAKKVDVNLIRKKIIVSL